jgi:pSer/pThr/pTyr-binding forkhead associated (FHA) protein
MLSEGKRMAEKKLPADLTSTIHLGSSKPEELKNKAGETASAAPHGEALQSLSLEEQDIVARLAKSNGMLIVHRGPGKGSRFLISGTTSIGRDPQSDVFLDDVTISRKHAAIALQNAEFILTDSGSLNGTYVNGGSVARVTLSDCDEIQIGKFHMLFFGGNK